MLLYLSAYNIYIDRPLTLFNLCLAQAFMMGYNSFNVTSRHAPITVRRQMYFPIRRTIRFVDSVGNINFSCTQCSVEAYNFDIDVWSFADCSRLQLQCRLCFIHLLGPCTIFTKLCLLIVVVCTWLWSEMAADCPFISADRKETLLLWCPFLRACRVSALAALGTPCPLGGQGVWACIPLNGCQLPILPGIMPWGLFTDNLMMVNCQSWQPIVGLLFTQCCWTRACPWLYEGPTRLGHTDIVYCMSSTTSLMRDGPHVPLQAVLTTSGAGSSCRCTVLLCILYEMPYILCVDRYVQIYICFFILLFYFSYMRANFCDLFNLSLC